MLKQFQFYLTIIFFVFSSCAQNPDKKPNTELPALINKNTQMENKITKTDEDWLKVLNPEEYRVLRKKGTEAPFSGKYYKHNEKGVYCCAGCGSELFSSNTKYDSGCGWPSYFDAISNDKIKTKTDTSLGMRRVEIMCAKCDGHLGHVFEDGPNPTGLRYCVNSVSLKFKEEE